MCHTCLPAQHPRSAVGLCPCRRQPARCRRGYVSRGGGHASEAQPAGAAGAGAGRAAAHGGPAARPPCGGCQHVGCVVGVLTGLALAHPGCASAPWLGLSRRLHAPRLLLPRAPQPASFLPLPDLLMLWFPSAGRPRPCLQLWCRPRGRAYTPRPRAGCEPTLLPWRQSCQTGGRCSTPLPVQAVTGPAAGAVVVDCAVALRLASCAVQFA